MDIKAWLSLELKPDATLTEVNKRLSASGMSITAKDARMLSERRAEALSEVGRMEFGQPAIVALVEAVATSPCLSQDDVACDLAVLQDAFYSIRDEMPVDVPDAEIAEALRGCLDEWGDVAMVASMPAEEVMGFSAEYVQAAKTENSNEYRIVDDEGRICTFDPTEWDYDEQADGWDGERWADDWDD